jgi:hypothetical protein
LVSMPYGIIIKEILHLRKEFTMNS